MKRRAAASGAAENLNGTSSPLSSNGITTEETRGAAGATAGARSAGIKFQRKLESVGKAGAASSSSRTSARGHGMQAMETGAATVARTSAPRSGNAPKKLLIRPFSTPPQLPDQYFTQTWENQLKKAVQAVHNKTSVEFSFEELYQKVEDLCRGRKTQQLSTKLEEECDQHIGEQIRSLKNSDLDPAAFLPVVDRVWQEHCSEQLTIRSIFLFLDRKYVIQTTYTYNLWDVGLQLFEKHLLENADVLEKTIAGLLALIEKDRDGEIVDKDLFKRLVEIFTSTKLYSTHLEERILDATTEYYRIDSVKKLQEYDLATYLRYVEQRMISESDRIIRYLSKSTRQGLVYAVEENLLAAHVSVMLEKGFDELCHEMRIDDLQRLYKQFSEVNNHDNCKALGALRDAFVSFIDKQKDDIVMKPEQDDMMVQSLLDFNEKLQKITAEAFLNDQSISRASKLAFSQLVNRRQSKPAELVSKYIDQILKAGNKKYNEDELDATLDKLMILFRSIQSKDIFEAFYEKDLAKRLLFDRSASLDLENTMISKLKVECGSAFTRKLEGMFKDVDLSTDIMRSFHESKGSSDVSGNVELKVNVLTTSFWPSVQSEEIKLPRELRDSEEAFKGFYVKKHSARKLNWQYANATCVLTANFAKRQHYLSVSLYQTLVLLLFNDADELGYEEIKAATQLTPKELDKTLLSLACGKHRVVTKKPKGPTINESDKFVYAKDFGKPLVHLKINSIQMQVTKEEKEETTELTFKERDHHIELAIVRIMKMRQTISHAQLITELYEQLKFNHSIAALKGRIEALIDKFYLERDANNPQIYRYLA